MKGSEMNRDSRASHVASEACFKKSLNSLYKGHVECVSEMNCAKHVASEACFKEKSNFLYKGNFTQKEKVQEH